MPWRWCRLLVGSWWPAAREHCIHICRQAPEGASAGLHVTPPGPALPPTAEVLEKPRAAREAVEEGLPLPVGAVGRPGMPGCSRCARLQLAPRPRPFLLSPFCSGPFDLGTRPLYVALGLARPLRPTQGWGFPFHLVLGAPSSERDSRRGLVVSQNLGDSAFSGALWPRSFDILSGNGNKGEPGVVGR